MVYNLSGLATNSTGPMAFAQNVNNVLMFGWLGTLFLIGISLVMFMAFMWSTQSVRASISATSFIAFIMSIFLVAMDLAPDFVAFVTLTCAAVAIGFAYKSE